jgi:hypothetical protein
MVGGGDVFFLFAYMFSFFVNVLVLDLFVPIVFVQVYK